MKLFIATPEYTPALPWMRASKGRVTTDLRANGVDVVDPICVTGAYLLAARNGLLRDAMRSECDAVLWWDGDVEALDPACVRAMLDTGHEVVGGIYARKDGTDRPVVELLPGAERVGDSWEVGRIGTGFLLMRMSAVTKLRDAHPERMLHDGTFALFRMPLVDGHEIGEDYAFCDDWRALGGKVYAHVPTKLRHWGMHGYEVKW